MIVGYKKKKAVMKWKKDDVKTFRKSNWLGTLLKLNLPVVDIY